jgi:hypothetical protein
VVEEVVVAQHRCHRADVYSIAAIYSWLDHWNGWEILKFFLFFCE